MADILLVNELTTDPLGRGYAGMTDQQAADSLNTRNRTRNKARMTGAEIFENTNPAEFNALPEGADQAGKATRNKKSEWLSFCGIEGVDPFGPAVQFVINVFGSGSVTVSNLSAARVETVSRAVELGIAPVPVKPGHVQEARNA
jgi:hypothetical protein